MRGSFLLEYILLSLYKIKKMDNTTKWYKSKYNCYGNLIHEVIEPINKGDLVSYYFKRKSTTLQGTWDGEKVCFKDKDDTVVRTTEWLKLVSKNRLQKILNIIMKCFKFYGS